jgi:hypothetical protein
MLDQLFADAQNKKQEEEQEDQVEAWVEEEEEENSGSDHSTCIHVQVVQVGKMCIWDLFPFLFIKT